MRTLKGQRDPLVQLMRALQRAQGRTERGFYLAETHGMVERALQYGADVRAIIATERYAATPEFQALVSEFPDDNICVTSQGLLAKIMPASKPTPPCVALVAREVHEVEALVPQDAPAFLLGVDHGELADNLGMLLRSAEAAGVDGVVLSQDTVDPFGRRVLRAARGAMFHMPLSIPESLPEALGALQTRGVQIVTTSVLADVDHTAPDYTRPTMLVVGNEHHGVREEVLNAADVCVRIPMMGKINSLNIAVAASIMLYEVRRQRGE